MKKMFFGILAVVLTSGISYASDVQQQDASIGLNVPQIIELVGIDMSESITPGPEDYARDLQVARVVNDVGGAWQGTQVQQVIAARSVGPGYTFPDETRSFVVSGRTMPVLAGSHGIQSTFIDAVCDAMGWAHGAEVTIARLEDIQTLYVARGYIAPTYDAGGNIAKKDHWWFYTETVPGPNVFAPGPTNNTGNEAAHDNAMYDANNDIGKGFAERTDALAMTIFTNAQDGAALYVHGLQPAQQQGILRLEDTYVAVCTEKTYILQNDLEGAYANACSGAVMETTTMTPSNTQRVEDNPRNNMGGDTEYTATMGTSTAGINVHGGAATDKAYSTWLRLHNQAQHLFEVKMSTKAPRLVVVNLGIANLARYTEGEYTNTLTFTLMPIVG